MMVFYHSKQSGRFSKYWTWISISNCSEDLTVDIVYYEVDGQLFFFSNLLSFADGSNAVFMAILKTL